MGLDGPALWLQEGRPCEPLPQRCFVLVYRKTWSIGGNFEEHPARLTEVDRTEVEPVDHRSHRRIDWGDAIPPLLMFLFVGSAECYVVNPTYANEAMERPLRLNLHMHLCTWSTRANLEDGHGCLLWRLIGTATAEAKHLGEKARRGFKLAQCKTNRIEAMNRHLGGYRTPAPGHTLQPPAIVYQFETLSLGIAEGQHQQTISTPCLYTVMGDVQIIKTLDPPVEGILAGHAQRDHRDRAGARLVMPDVGPFKEGQVGTGPPKFISIEEMIG